MGSPQAIRALEMAEAIPGRAAEATLGDLRFRALLSAADWEALPYAVRRRFSKRLANGQSVVYAGEVTEAQLTWRGRIWGQLARLAGAPLPLSSDTGVPAVVSVTEDMRTGGQIWTRMYARRRNFPQVIHSSKRFEGATGLEEYVGLGVGMKLTVHVEDGALLFVSAGYFVRIGRWRIPLPRFLTPGRITVTHTNVDDSHFTFTLDVVHPRHGEIIRQWRCSRRPRHELDASLVADRGPDRDGRFRQRLSSRID